ncbi:MAG TPA: bifunctional diguanylate cyclase/phosphodiesterase, partial [Microthrixaceae bacterium]|nr:bifunctional diguanylate cyclase/phosphodiesterase [Microthrixaceae bacterium]
HELLAELARRDHRLDEAFRHLQTTRCLEDEFRARAGALAEDRVPLLAAVDGRGGADGVDEADRLVVVLEDREVVIEGGRAVIEGGGAVLDDGQVVLERRVESLESNLDERTRELEQALIDLRDLADRSQLDPLTGLASRQHLTDVLNELIGAPSPGAVIAIDLDRFGRINETLGHEAGDTVLAEVAQRLRRSVRPRDTLARWGGDEFMVLLPGLRDLAAATAAAEVVRTAITATLRIGDDEIVPSASIGVAVAGDSMADPAALLRAADTALERAKALGKGRVEVFGDELADDARRRFDTEAALRHALDHGGFELHFQPVHPNRPDEPLAAEALLRMSDPRTGGLLSPGSFLDVAEETGLARPIGDWVLDAACAAAGTWARTGVPFHLAVNVSASQLDPAFPDLVAATLARHGVEASILVIELTEHSLLEADDAQVAALVDLRSTGVRIALDDFGTAYSSLSHLRRFPVDIVKIDQSFVAGICRNERDHAIVRAVVDLAQTFHFQVIAEGVETTEQLDQQRRLGCDGAQGFLIGRPKPAAAFAELLSTRFMFEALSARSA